MSADGLDVAPEVKAGLNATSARWQARGEAHFAETAERADRAAQADSERYAAQAEYYAAGDRAMADGDAFLADNPEMILVRRFQEQKGGGDIPQLLCCVDTSDLQ